MSEEFIEARIQQGISPRDALIELYSQHGLNTMYIESPNNVPDEGELNKLGLSPEFVYKYYILPSGFAKGSMEFAGDIPLANLTLANVLMTSGQQNAVIINGMRTGGNQLSKLPCISTVEGDLYIPVLRYENPGGGLYFDKTDDQYYSADDQFCGTFYYLVPDSGFYLKSRKTLIVPTLEFAYYLLTGQPVYEEYILYPPNWMDQIIDKCKAGQVLTKADERRWPSVGNMLDQPVCEVARNNGIDVVIVTYPFGVEPSAEVLDTRDRQSSYTNLVRV